MVIMVNVAVPRPAAATAPGPEPGSLDWKAWHMARDMAGACFGLAPNVRNLELEGQHGNPMETTVP